jgi:hypothetical protein
MLQAVGADHPIAAPGQFGERQLASAGHPGDQDSSHPGHRLTSCVGISSEATGKHAARCFARRPRTEYFRPRRPTGAGSTPGSARDLAVSPSNFSRI